MVKIGLLSDTHGFLDPDLLPILKECDEIWHAGDLGSLDVLKQLRSFKLPLRAVYGNIDGHDIRIDVPEVESWYTEKMKVLMIHIGGYPGHYPSRIKALLKAEQPDIFICGHSHILKVIYDKELQLLHINPGACGREGFHKTRTMIRFTIDADKVKDLAIVEMGKR
jgi:putative phosphoesterase